MIIMITAAVEPNGEATAPVVEAAGRYLAHLLFIHVIMSL